MLRLPEYSVEPWALVPVSGVIRQPAKRDWILRRVGAPPVGIAHELERRGFRFDSDWTDRKFTQLGLLAANLISLMPSLEAVVTSCVRKIHVLSADLGFDIGHSEPRWRKSIFVSRPESVDQIAGLRFAENIIHEAMHLHLTNIEEATPLVQDFHGLMASPWRTENRSFQGVLHALFVFTCLAVYFRSVTASPVIDTYGLKHIALRLGEINSEVGRLNLARLLAGLTSRGAAVAKEWYLLATEASPRR